MADVFLKASITFRDDIGLDSVSRFIVHGTGADATEAAGDARVQGKVVGDAMVAVSNGYAAAGGGILTQVYGDDGSYGANADYESCSDEAVLRFKTALGSIHTLHVPAPLKTMFDDASIVVVNAGGTATLITAVLAHCTSISGEALTRYVGGRRVKRRRRALLSNLKTEP